MDILGAAFNHLLLCLSLVSGDHDGFIEFGMLCSRCHWEGRRKVNCCGCTMYTPPSVSYRRHVCVGSMVHRLEGVALIFNAGLCALNFVLTIKVPVIDVLGTWHLGTPCLISPCQPLTFFFFF